MIESVFFVLTAVVVVFNTFIAVGNTGTLPSLLGPNFPILEPNNWFIAYPSFLYQIHFWALHFHIIPM